MTRFRSIPLVCMAALMAMTLPSRSPGHSTGADMAAGALAFLHALDTGQRREATVAFDSDAREDWHYVPKRRAGLPLKKMAPEQRALALAFVRTALSARGYDKVSRIIELETVLAELEGGGASSHRDPDLYYLLIAGTPAPHGTWGWRFEGHHLSLNITIVRGESFAVTPSFLGANPAEIRAGPRQGERILAEEEDLARALLLSLDGRQRSVAIIAQHAPFDILTRAARRVDPLAPAGIAAATMNEAQQVALLKLIETYVTRHRAELSAADLDKVRAAGVDNIHFAWAGGLNQGEAHYYRVQGPTFLLEYDNTQNGANHIHTVWRDFEGDFGRDLLMEHREAQHAPATP